MEVEAVDEGVLAKIVVPEGTADVPVNDLIALIAEEGEDPSSIEAGGGKAEAKPAGNGEAKGGETKGDNAKPRGEGGSGGEDRTPAAARWRMPGSMRRRTGRRSRPARRRRAGGSSPRRSPGASPSRRASTCRR